MSAAPARDVSPRSQALRRGPQTQTRGLEEAACRLQRFVIEHATEIVPLLRPRDILTSVDDGENINAGGLREIENTVRVLEDFAHVLILRLRCAQSDTRKLRESIDAPENALNHALGVKRRSMADV